MKAWIAVGLALFCLQSVSAAAQEICPAGHALFGGCVNPAMDERARTRSVLMVQRRISISQQLTLPRADRAFLTAGSRSYLR